MTTNEMIEKNGRFCIIENNDGTFSYSDENGNPTGSFDLLDDALRVFKKLRRNMTIFNVKSVDR